MTKQHTALWRKCGIIAQHVDCRANNIASANHQQAGNSRPKLKAKTLSIRHLGICRAYVMFIMLLSCAAHQRRHLWRYGWGEKESMVAKDAITIKTGVSACILPPICRRWRATVQGGGARLRKYAYGIAWARYGRQSTSVTGERGGGQWKAGEPLAVFDAVIQAERHCGRMTGTGS